MEPANARPCRVVVWAHSPTDALALTLADVLADLGPGERVDVWAGTDAVARPADERVRWHLPCEGLAAALRELQPDAASDVAWVRAGVRVPPGWRQALQRSLLMGPRLGTVSPLSLDDPWFTPLPDRLQETLRAEPVRLAQDLSQWLGLHAPAQAVAVDAPLGDAGVMAGALAVRVATRSAASCAKGPVVSPADGDEPGRAATATGADGVFEADEAGWPLVAVAAGLGHGVCRQVVVCRSTATVAGFQPAPAGTGSTPRPGLGLGPRPSPLWAHRDLWRQAHPLTGLRHAVQTHWSTIGTDVKAPVVQVQAAPVRLHVAHSWGGGLAKWVADFNRADREQGSGLGLVLRSVGVFGAFGQRLTLHAGDEDGAPLRYWELGVPIHATVPTHPQVQAILEEIITDFKVEQVLVSSLIGHSLDVLRTGQPTVLVAHDHHPFCVALYASFDGECRQCDRQRLGRCLQSNPAHRFFNGVEAADWMALREAFVDLATEQHLPIVAPSKSVAQRWQALMPRLRAGQFRVIEHGLKMPPCPPFEPPLDGRLRVVVLGRLSPEKGVDLLMQCLPELLQLSEVLLVGCGERLDPALRAPRVTVVPDFDNDELPAILASWRPHVGLLMSTVPETFSYALSELWHCGLPVLARDQGALADRITPGVDGWLLPGEASAWLHQLTAINRDRAGLLVMRQTLLARPGRSLGAMVRDYEALLPRAPRSPAHASERGPGLGGHAALIEELAQVGHRTEQDRYRRALHVNPAVTWRQAARAFLQYTVQKAARSPRVPHLIRRVLARWH